MVLRLTDPIAGASRLTPTVVDGIKARIVEPDAKDLAFWTVLPGYCDKAKIDGAIAAAQHLLETANQQSPRWNQDTNRDGYIDLNPGGIGIPSDSSVQPFVIANADEAARIFVQCIYAMVHKERTDAFAVPAAAEDWFTKVWLRKVQAPEFPKVVILDDLDVRYVGADGEPRATWAWDGTDDGDPAYADKVVDRGNEFMPTASGSGSAPSLPVDPSGLRFGLVPHPGFQNRPIRKANHAGMDLLGPRDVYGVTLHRMLGTLWGTDGYFRLASVNALTDYGIGTAAQDGIDNDGLIIRWNDPNGDQSGWASGPVDAPYGDGKKFVDKYGVNAVNRFRVSIEVSGIYYSTPISTKTKMAIAALIAYYADQDGIPWDKFPIRPKDGLNFVLHHQHFTIGTGKVCSGDVVMAATADIIELARAIMKNFQGSIVEPKPVQYVAPLRWTWMVNGSTGFGEDHWIGNTEIIYLPVDVEVVDARGADRFANGANGSPPAGPKMLPKLKFHSDYLFRSGDNGRSYRMTKNGVRVYADRLSPYDAVTVNGTVTRYSSAAAKRKGEKGTVVRSRPKKGGKQTTKQAA